MQEVMERRIDGVEPPEANLNWHRDLQGGRPTVVFDFDSLLVFPSSLAIAKRGVHYNPISPGTSELHTDVHISVRVNYIDHDGQQHQKQIPLFKFRIIVLDELSDGKILRRPLYSPHFTRNIVKILTLQAYRCNSGVMRLFS
jgi:hypothetical protein